MLDGLASSWRQVAGVPVVVLSFLFAVGLLGAGTEAAAPLLREAFVRYVVGDAGALGFGWLGAYVLTNGSVVAAVALSLSTAGLLGPSQVFLMVAGTRLGGAAIVVVVGALDYFQKERYSLQQSVSLGSLTFLLTHSVYVPATVVGYVALPVVRGEFAPGTGAVDGGFGLSNPFSPMTSAFVDAVGPGVAVVVAVGALFGSLTLFDRLLSGVDVATLRELVFDRFERTWVSFAIGLVVTSATTSVAFSLGVIVPLYNRGYVKREGLLPYVLGANVGTLFDTLVAAFVLDSPVAVVVVLTLAVAALLATLVALLAMERYANVVVGVDDLLLEDRRVFLAFLASLAVAPFVFLSLGLAFG
ncbi:sodium:phosphate symporter [Halorubellus litoreus]|uniref:Sodium:phosphate symporter n=1 Tax=Halorubellus litoreus TaxID=755308 RepID=A0ABD5VHL3_9EURY